MKLTKEQEAVIASDENIKLNAVAGSGKTTTLVEYAKSRPFGKSILYLAFNKTVRQEAQRRFDKIGLVNVEVHTAHSLAYKNIIKGTNTKVSFGYSLSELVDLLDLNRNIPGDKFTKYSIAKHINKYMSLYLNSSEEYIEDVDYVSSVSDHTARDFVKRHLDNITWKTQLFFEKMDEGEIDVLHDFYLKKFQLSKPELQYDYILFDEAQDASPAMLDIVLSQHKDTIKVIVGDTNQQIYGWRGAINSLESVDYKQLNLSNSFRFGKDIAFLSKEILHLKSKFNSDMEPVQIQGLSKSHPYKGKKRTIIARTNIGLLSEAIKIVKEKNNSDSFYFEGNINSYTYAEEGTSLYDVLSLFTGDLDRVRDKFIRSMRTMKNLEKYIEKTGDVQLSIMVAIVKRYSTSIYFLINEIKRRNVSRNEADVIFSTVHKSKGLEYDKVVLVNDFTSETKLSDSKQNGSQKNEEINMIYVAVTRAKKNLVFPKEIFEDRKFKNTKHIKYV